MIINKDIISKLGPCKDRFDNYVEFYRDRDFTPKQFMGLKNITHSDKMWVALRLVDKNKLKFIAADIAQSVLYIYENDYPNDLKPRKAIEAARNKHASSAAKAASSAAKAAYCSPDAASCAASSAAEAASCAASSAAEAAYCADDASYAASCAASYAASYASYPAYKLRQEKLNRTFVLKYWLKKGREIK